MSTTRLPELPEPSTRYYCNKCGQAGDTQRHHRPHGPECNYLAVAYKARGFTANQMHAYGLAVWKAAMEAAAKECERYEGEQWQKYKRGHGPERASDYCQGQSNGGGDCANAIRSLPLPEQGSPQERRE